MTGGVDGNVRPACCMNRAMAGETVDGIEGDSWPPPCLDTGLTARGAVDAGKAARCPGGVEPSGPIAEVGAGAWAAQGSGATQEMSRAVARIDGHAVLIFINEPRSFRKLLDASPGMG